MEQEKENAQLKSETQNDILLAALKLFVDKGYFNTSLSDISQAAGLKNTTLIYNYFKNKQHIASELYATIFDSLNISIDDIRRRNGKASEQLHGIVDLLFKLTEDAPDIMRFLLLLKFNEFLPQEKPLLETPAFTKIIKIMGAGIKSGEIRNIDARLCYSYFFGIIDNTLRCALRGELEKKIDAYQSQTWLAAWHSIAKK